MASLEMTYRFLRRLGGGGSVRLLKDGLVATVLIDNPTERNAMTANMMADLRDVVTELKTFDGVAVVMRGAGDTFCSGASLSLASVLMEEPRGGVQMCNYMQTFLHAFKSLPQVSVAAIEGFAVGGGAELTTASDFRVAAPTATIHFKHAHMGLSPGWGGATRLAGIVGRRAALRLLCGAEKVSASEAAAFGLVDAVTDDFEHIVAPFVEAATKGSPQAVRGMKTVVNAADATSGQVVEARVFESLWGGPDAKARLAATREGLQKK